MSHATRQARTVVGNISLSLDGRVTGPGGEYDMGWIVPHAITDTARNHMVDVTTPATTVLLGRKNYQGFGFYWPAVADDDSADPRDRAFSQWLNAVEKIVFSSTLKEPTWENSRIVDADPSAVVEELRLFHGGHLDLRMEIQVAVQARRTAPSRADDNQVRKHVEMMTAALLRLDGPALESLAGERPQPVGFLLQARPEA